MLSRLEFSQEPGAGQFPIAHDSILRDGEDGGGFAHAQAAEEAQFDDTGFAGIESGESAQGLVESDELGATLRSEVGNLVEVDARGVATPFGRGAFSGGVEQDVPHHLGGHGKEVSAVLPVDIIDLNQLEICLVNQDGSLDRAAGVFILHEAAGQAAELPVDVGREAVQRGLAAIRPGAQKLRGFRRLGATHGKSGWGNYTRLHSGKKNNGGVPVSSRESRL